MYIIRFKVITAVNFGVLQHCVLWSIYLPTKLHGIASRKMVILMHII
jgi:hypothetical protein